MPTETQTSRTLVKSPPELWAECSDPTSLARHLDGFGDIRITKLEPETAVAWEGERACGTVRLEPSGWGTRVVLTATGDPAPSEPAGVAATSSRVPSRPAQDVERPQVPGTPPAPARREWLARLLGRPRTTPADPGAAAAPARDRAISAVRPVPRPPSPTAEGLDPGASPDELLNAALESLGQAHRRPFTRR